MRGLNPIIAILAIIGAIVVLGVVLKVAFKLIGLALVVGLVVIGIYVVQGMTGKKL